MKSVFISYTIIQLLLSPAPSQGVECQDNYYGVAEGIRLNECRNMGSGDYEKYWCQDENTVLVGFYTDAQCSSSTESWTAPYECTLEGNIHGLNAYPCKCDFNCIENQGLSLTTPAWNTGMKGIMFDVKANNNIRINNIEFKFNGCIAPATYKLYKRRQYGTFLGYEKNPAAWEIACTGVLPCSQSGYNTGSCPIDIQSGQIQALYLYGVDRGLLVSDTGIRGEISVQNNELIVYTGTPTWAEFDSVFVTDSCCSMTPSITIDYEITVPNIKMPVGYIQDSVTDISCNKPLIGTRTTGKMPIYRFISPGVFDANEVYLEGCASTHDIWLYLFDSNGELIYGADDQFDHGDQSTCGNSYAGDITVKQAVFPGDVYYFGIGAYNNGAGNYDVTLMCGGCEYELNKCVVTEGEVVTSRINTCQGDAIVMATYWQSNDCTKSSLPPLPGTFDGVTSYIESSHPCCV